MAADEGFCTMLAIQEGLVNNPPDIDDLHFISDMAEYLFEEEHEPFVYSWDDNWSFGSVPVQKIAETVIARMRITGFLLKYRHCCTKSSIHIWNDGDTLAFVLAFPSSPDYDIDAIGTDYEAVAAVSYTRSSGHHFDLVGRAITNYINFKPFIEDGRDVVGFPSYPCHDLDRFLIKTGADPYFTKSGEFSVHFRTQSGAEVFEATDEALSILKMI